MWCAALWVTAVVVQAAPAVELGVKEERPADGKPCARVYTTADTQLRGCGNTMEFWVNNARVGKPVALGDMNVKGVRAFQDGARVVFVVDVGDEGNSSLSFHALAAGKHVALGSVDWMVDDGDSPSALPVAVAEVKDGVLSFRFSKPLVQLDKAGMPVAVKNAHLTVTANKVVTPKR